MDGDRVAYKRLESRGRHPFPRPNHPGLPHVPVRRGDIQGAHGAEYQPAEPVTESQAAHQAQAGQLAACTAPGVAVAQIPHGQRERERGWTLAALVLGSLWLHRRCTGREKGLRLSAGSQARPRSALLITLHSPRNAVPTSSGKVSMERPWGRRRRLPSAPDPRVARRRPIAMSTGPEAPEHSSATARVRRTNQGATSGLRRLSDATSCSRLHVTAQRRDGGVAFHVPVTARACCERLVSPTAPSGSVPPSALRSPSFPVRFLTTSLPVGPTPTGAAKMKIVEEPNAFG